MGYLEREIFPALSASQREGVRSVVLDAFNSYHDSVLDLVKAEDSVRNDVVVEAIERLERRFVTQQRTRATSEF